MKHHTFRVSCSFSLQYTFTDPEVTSDADGDIAPNASALAELQAELANILGKDYAVSSLKVDAESGDLLGTTQE